MDVQRSPDVAIWIADTPAHHETVIRILEQLPNDLANVTEPEQPTTMLTHAIVRLLEKLDQSKTVGDDTIARLEVPFVRALIYNGRTKLAIHRKIASDPALFADLIASVYKRDDGTSEAETNEQTIQVKAEILNQIIFGKSEIPGKTEGGMVDYESLSVWITEARRLCAERNRKTPGDYYIGNLLALSPTGEDGIWPCEAVRKVLDSIDLQHIGTGFIAGKINLRGATTRAVFSGGAQERALANEHKRQADTIMFRWPQTATLLRRIADVYRHNAQRIDQEDDELDQFGF